MNSETGSVTSREFYGVEKITELRGFDTRLVPREGLLLLKLFIPPMFDGAWLVFLPGGTPVGVLSPQGGRMLAEVGGRSAGEIVCGPSGVIDPERCDQLEQLLTAGLLAVGTQPGTVHWIAPDSVDGTRHQGPAADLFIRYFYEYFGSVFHDGSSLIDSHGDFLPVLRRYFPNGKQVLNCVDLGCGSGHYAAALAKMGHSVYAVDISLTRLAAAAARDTNTGRIIPVEGNIEDVPLPDSSFDFVMCNFVLEHVADHFTVVDEMARLLRPGGHFLVAVPSFNIRDTLAFWAFGEPPSLNFEHLRSFGLIPGTHQWCASTMATVKRVEDRGVKVEAIEGIGILDHLWEPWLSSFKTVSDRIGADFARTWPWNCLGQQTVIHGVKRNDAD